MARRLDPDLTIINRAADRIEPRMARSVVKAAGVLRARVPVEAITEALEAGDVAEAARLAESMDIADAYVPMGRIIGDAVIVGGKIGAAEIVDELG